MTACSYITNAHRYYTNSLLGIEDKICPCYPDLCNLVKTNSTKNCTLNIDLNSCDLKIILQ